MRPCILVIYVPGPCNLYVFASIYIYIQQYISGFVAKVTAFVRKSWQTLRVYLRNYAFYGRYNAFYY